MPSRNFDCPACGWPHDVEFEITYYGSSGSWDEPPEGAEIDDDFPEHCESTDPNCIYTTEEFPDKLSNKWYQEVIEMVEMGDYSYDKDYDDRDD